MEMKLVLLIAVPLLLLAIMIFIVYSKYHRNKMEQQRRDDLINHLPTDNQLLEDLYRKIDYLSTHFQLTWVLKRRVLHGTIDGTLLMIKFKKSELRVGIPATFRVREAGFDQAIDLSKLEGRNNVPDIMGAENYFWYVVAEPKESSILKGIAHAQRIKDAGSPKDRRKESFGIDDFDEYLRKIQKLNYEYM